MRACHGWLILAAACGEAATVKVEDGLAPKVEDGFVWRDRPVPPIRVTPLGYDGEPVRCVTDVVRPCDIEITAQGALIDRARSPAEVATVGPGLRIHMPARGDVFAVSPGGDLVGLGPFHSADHAQMLFCRLTAEPALHCHHDVRPNVKGRVRNEENCSAQFVARVDGATIVAGFPTLPPASGQVVARIDPLPTRDGERALALFLFALHAVYGDAVKHTPRVDPW